MYLTSLINRQLIKNEERISEVMTGANEMVSIGMPVYNDKAFLTAALDSLRNQIYQNFELIISDDCSTDGSANICLQAQQMDKRVKYIRQPQNIGISRNMEFLLKQATGKYFMWAANDDLWHPDFIQELVGGLEKNPNAIAAFCNVTEIDDDGTETKTHDAELINYSGAKPEIRLKKLIKVFYDGFGYGLFVKDKIKDVRFPVWWWLNKKCPYNNIYPTLCYYLTKGDYVSCGSAPLWFNRIKTGTNIHHKVPFQNNFLRGYFAFVLRTFNLACVSLHEVKRAGGSPYLIFKISFPMFYHWFLKPAYYELIDYSKRLYRRQIKFW